MFWKLSTTRNNTMTATYMEKGRDGKVHESGGAKLIAPWSVALVLKKTVPAK